MALQPDQAKQILQSAETAGLTNVVTAAHEHGADAGWVAIDNAAAQKFFTSCSYFGIKTGPRGQYTAASGEEKLIELGVLKNGNLNVGEIAKVAAQYQGRAAAV